MTGIHNFTKMKVVVRHNRPEDDGRLDSEDRSIIPLLLAVGLLLVSVYMWYAKTHDIDTSILPEWPQLRVGVHDTVYVHDTIYVHDTTVVVKEVITRREAAPDTAHYTVAQIYSMYRGEAGVKQDKARAARYARPLAEKGDVECQMLMGNYYYSRKPPVNAFGVKPDDDYRNAFYWYKRAAEAGNHKAMRYVSEMYRNGLGVKQNTREADRWAARAQTP